MKAWRPGPIRSRPFCYARAFEQIRNDICLHGLPVKLLANGGGYAYGVMGPTHHALEDYGILLTLANMTRIRAGLHRRHQPTVSAQATLRVLPMFDSGRAKSPRERLSQLTRPGVDC